MVTIAEPSTKTKQSTYTRVDKKGTTTRQWDSDPISDSNDNTDNPLEWYIDDEDISRNDDDPFHILLLNQTFVKNPRMTIHYCLLYTSPSPRDS